MMKLEEQLKLEESYTQLAKEKFKINLQNIKTKGVAGNSIIGKRLESTLIDKYSINVLNWLEKEISPKKRGVQKEYKSTLLNFVDTIGLKTLTMLCVSFTLNVSINSVFSSNPTFSTQAHTIGKAIYNEIKVRAFLKDNKYYVNGTQKTINNETSLVMKCQKINRILNQHNFEYVAVTGKILTEIGGILLNLLIDSCDLFETGIIGGNKSLSLLPSQKLLDIWNTAEGKALKNYFKFIPTIIPPKPWTSIDDGGYYGVLNGEASLIRFSDVSTKSRLHQLYLNKLSEVDLSSIMTAINKLQNTAYTINKEMLDLIKYYINLGGGRAGIPSLEPLQEPTRLENFDELPKSAQVAHMKLVSFTRKEEKARRSKALRALQILDMATLFKDYDNIYFPLNMDFRGRIYPIPTFNHQGDDLMKSLLLYSFPEPCKSANDIKLLEIQGCNLYGNDKISLQDRVNWVEENKNHILESANNPIEYTWWQNADEPLQFLVFCKEYKRALEYIKENGSIIGFKCHIVIAFDGTCSGLQHYSAILRDRKGGSSVNLVDHDKPSDIYQEVADKVVKVLEYDAIHGTTDEPTDNNSYKWGTKTLAQTWLAYGVNRKVCKSAVMTFSYGATKRGMMEHIASEITMQDEMFRQFANPAATYLVNIIWDKVTKTSVSAYEGMKYLQELSKKLLENDYPVTWVTPLGLPIQQHYLKTKRQKFRTRLGTKISMPLYFNEIVEGEHVDPKKQAQSIAPNFIHSLDATHLMLVVLRTNFNCYTTIHDSFGTSLGNASELKRAIRQEMYNLYHNFDPFQTFKEHIEMLIGYQIDDIKTPKRGDLDLKEILSSTYIFH